MIPSFASSNWRLNLSNSPVGLFAVVQSCSLRFALLPSLLFPCPEIQRVGFTEIQSVGLLTFKEVVYLKFKEEVLLKFRVPVLLKFKEEF